MEKQYDEITGCWTINTRINGKLFTAYFATDQDAQNYLNKNDKSRDSN